jgi:serine O-acetyltransferase
VAFSYIRKDIAAIYERDPAVRSLAEVWLTYPGFHSILAHRLAYRLWRRNWRLSARVLSHMARFISGIEIHPGAKIGAGFFIDHGTGVVIGETSEIGDNVTLYHDVTLGGLSPAVDSAKQIDVKRHPTLADGVIVGSGAQVLGPITVGAGARVGANAVVLKDVPAGATVVGNPARIAKARREADTRFQAYGTDRDELADPVARMIDGLLDQIEALQARIVDMERRQAERGDRLPWGEEAEEKGKRLTAAHKD